MTREAIPARFFVLVVVRREDRFLIVRERGHQQSWYLPAGGAELRESLIEAAHRETREESGVPIVLEGVLKILQTIQSNEVQFRFLFLARPADETVPRTTPNEHSLEARFVTLDELDALPLRGPEVRAIFQWVADGAQAAPMELLAIQ